MSERPHRRFDDRVSIERKVLGVVNQLMPEQQLHGLTDAAIETWRLRMPTASQRDNAIIRLVVEIARRSKIHVDTSRDIFDDEGIPELSSIERLVLELRHLSETAA